MTAFMGMRGRARTRKTYLDLGVHFGPCGKSAAFELDFDGAAQVLELVRRWRSVRRRPGRRRDGRRLLGRAVRRRVRVAARRHLSCCCCCCFLRQSASALDRTRSLHVCSSPRAHTISEKLHASVSPRVLCTTLLVPMLSNAPAPHFLCSRKPGTQKKTDGCLLKVCLSLGAVQLAMEGSNAVTRRGDAFVVVCFVFLRRKCFFVWATGSAQKSDRLPSCEAPLIVMTFLPTGNAVQDKVQFRVDGPFLANQIV